MNIIKKCLDELQKDTFRKDYVIGLLESFYEMQSGNPVVKTEEQTYDRIKPLVEEAVEEIPAHLRAGPVVDFTDGRRK